MALSAAGRAIRPHAEQLLHAVALAPQAVHDLRPASGGALRIAAVLSTCTYLLPEVLTRFLTAYSKILITLRWGHSKEVLEMVLRAESWIARARSGGIACGLQVSEQGSKVMAVIRGEEVMKDEIIRTNGFTSPAISAILLGLEMKRIVKQLPGRQYARNPAINI